MPPENEEQQDDVQQNDNTQIEQVSTGDKGWDKIIDDAAGLKPEGANDGTQQQQVGQTKPGTRTDGTQQRQQTQQREQQQQQPEIDPKTGKPVVQQDGQGAREGEGVQPSRTTPRKFGNIFQSDARGDIYDANGALIARQGAQRMIFHRLWPTIEAGQRELTGLRERVSNYENANALAKKEGLSLDEHGAALQMFVQWKRDPVKTLATLLTVAEQGGKDITSIRQSQGLSLSDVRSAVKEIFDEGVKPFSFLTAQQQQNEEEAQLHDAVLTEYNAFKEEFPDATIHEGAIANVMRDKGLNHREAYFAVRAFAAERRLDWNKPLVPQLTGEQQQQRNPSGGGNNRRQMPSMGGRVRSEAAHVEEGANDQANADESWDAIARRAMARHGIQV